MSIWCKLFGHSKGEYRPDNYWLVGGNDWKDGIGRTHITVAAKCWNCGKYFDHKHVCLGVIKTDGAKP